MITTRNFDVAAVNIIKNEGFQSFWEYAYYNGHLEDITIEDCYNCIMDSLIEKQLFEECSILRDFYNEWSKSTKNEEKLLCC